MGMNKLNTDERVQIIRCLVEGNSINSTCRITGRSKHTVLNLLAYMGEACQKFHEDKVRGIAAKRMQVDEIWNFCHCKQKNVPAEKQGQLGVGDVWTWVGIDADTKLIVSYVVGGRTREWAQAFTDDIADRVITRFQLTSDGHRSYLEAVENTFGGDVDYAQLIKVYGNEKRDAQARYSPGVVLSVELNQVSGDPDPDHISTSYVERSNLTMRMSMRRFTRLTNAFSKKFENLRHAVALNFVYYNFCRIHQTLRVTPAMEAGITDRIWELDDLVLLPAA
jgi:IS1 family transposase